MRRKDASVFLYIMNKQKMKFQKYSAIVPKQKTCFQTPNI